MRVAEQLLALGSFSSSSVSTGRAAGGEGCVWEISGRHARYRGGRRRLSGRRVSASSRRAASCGAAEEPTDLQPRAPVTVPASRRGVCDAHTETTLPAASARRQRRQRSVRRQLAWQADLAHTRPAIVRRIRHRSAYPPSFGVSAIAWRIRVFSAHLWLAARRLELYSLRSIE